MSGQQVSNDTILQIFKKVYGKISNLVPEDMPLLEDIKFSQKEKVGESYSEAVVLTNETGWTLGGTAADLFDINPAKAGAVKQASITPYVSILSSVVPWAVLARSAKAGEKAFIDGTKHLVASNVRSHMSLVHTLAYYGQATALLGYVSYATATYRGVSFTNGSGTLNGVAFTNGVNTTSKHILLSPGQFAAGIWVGREGATVHQVNSSGVVVATGNLVSVESEYGYIEVDFTPVAASSTTSHRLCFEGMEAAKDMVGMNKIMKNTGSLFGISAAQYSLWKGTVTSAASGLLTFNILQKAAAAAMNRGGLVGDVKVKVNPRSFASLINAEAARRHYDSSYGPIEYENGAREISFYYAGGKMSVEGDRTVKEGEAYGYLTEDWVRSGSTEVSLTIPGVDKPIIFPLENSSGQMFRSFSDQYMFCRAPARQFLIESINDEASA